MKNLLRPLILLLVITNSQYINAQIIGDQPPYVLTTAQVKSWTTTGSTASDDLIATQPLLARFTNTNTQFNPQLSNNTEIAYLPDGMNNFGNYSEEQDQFNLFNFTNWAYIDKLVWFGGTADLPVLLPSAPWVNTAHKNGVKVYANLFFAPNAFGGSTSRIQDFLEQDTNGDFVVIPIMVAMMEYYNFDGWFVNQETNTDAATGQLVYEFLKELTAQVESLNKDVMWYDAMNLNGNVNWQNRLNEINSPFVQNDEDGNTTNGFEQRVSSSIFINFFWSGTILPSQSKDRAQIINRSEFEVFTGVDVWPGRNQGRFETVGNTWMGWIHENATIAKTSLGLFAPNCVYNNSEYSTFNNNPNDFESFYSEERHMFAGADRNPQLEDPSGFKGYSNWIPAASTITEIPFETNFNTGHGFRRFEEGVVTSEEPWHNMNDQDILPNWQFAFSEGSSVNGKWNFNSAFNSGNSLQVSGNLNPGVDNDLTLYKTAIPIVSETKIDLIYEYRETDDLELSYVLTFEDDPNTDVVLPFEVNDNLGWAGNSILLEDYAGRTLATIGLRFKSNIGINNYIINISNIRVHNGAPIDIDILGTEDLVSFEDGLQLIYPNNSDHVILASQNKDIRQVSYSLYTIDGRFVTTNKDTFRQNKIHIRKGNLTNGIYILVVKDEHGNSTTKKMVLY